MTKNYALFLLNQLCVGASVDAKPIIPQFELAQALGVAIKALEQQQKTGRWIRWYEVIESADGKSTDHIPHCKCSECGTKYDPHSSQFIKYCNECGARMVESEDKE